MSPETQRREIPKIQKSENVKIRNLTPKTQKHKYSNSTNTQKYEDLKTQRPKNLKK